MILTASSVVRYLLERRFVFPSEIVSGDFHVRSCSRRNRNLSVESAGRHYLVKQAGKWTADARRGIETEALLYRGAAANGSFHFLRDHVPACHAYAPAASVLILDYLQDHCALDDLSQRFSPVIAVQAGCTLAILHANTKSESFQNEALQSPPWIFNVEAFDEQTMPELSEGRREFVQMLGRYQEFADSLKGISSEWHLQCLIHADFKLANLLYSERNDEVRIVDWENMQWGDPIWDIATLLQSYWNFHIRQPRRFSLELIRPALCGVLQGYAETARFASSETILKLIRFAGARMLQSTYEYLEDAERLDAPAIRLMQASLNVMKEPAQAAALLLGQTWETLSWN